MTILDLLVSNKKAKKGEAPEFFSQQVAEADWFYLDNYARTRQPLNVVCGGWERCEPDYRIDRLDFPFYSIEFVARGRGVLNISDKKHALRPGNVFSYGPGVPHFISTDVTEPFVKYFVDFTGPKAKTMLRTYSLAPGSVVRISSPDAILRIFDDLIANGNTGSRFSSPICATLVQHLMLKIAETVVVEDKSSTAAFTTYQTCREFIRDNAMNLRTLKQVAGQCRVDEAYLCRLFKRYDDQSPYEYLMRLRMNIAAQRLQKPDVLVKQVAYELGFTDPFHFSRAFKRVFGLSPGAFRQLR
jgi:AraC-like DNA-binding protein